ncbi:carboxylesterase family protein [Gynurincola endophyticus]|uniref:carboxylesterase family protein n=1 Tax=Gynurincola endophyticus TaxID=2479004 RepID=UPI000F8D263B|nr:alpha/beta hydrolase-fold protein [Gynurincola endophyticus]
MKQTALLTNIFLSVFLLISCSKGGGDRTVDVSLASIATMTTHTFTTTDNGHIGYWLYTPENPTDNMPLIIYLHGGSGRGSDLSLVTGASLPQFIRDGSVKDIPAYILMPQCAADKTWEQIGAAVIELMENIAVSKKINTDKVSITGHSFGGSGTWRLGATYSTKFSCIAPLSGSVPASAASAYSAIPVWAFAGANDTIIDPSFSIAIIPLINNLGGNAQIKIYDHATHFEVPELTYKDHSVNILNWMISNSRR